MGCGCSKRRKQQITSANVTADAPVDTSTDAVEALAAGAANTPVSDAQSRVVRRRRG